MFNRLTKLVEADERFGVVVLDPPKFARTGSAVEEAMRGYRRLIQQALRLLEPDGILAMCCCSGLIQRDMLHELLAQEASQARRPLQILESRGAGGGSSGVGSRARRREYLKCVICRLG